MTRSWIRWAPFTMALVAAAPLPLAVALFRAHAAPAEPASAVPPPAIGARSGAAGGLDSATGPALRAAPFRADGKPSAIAYDPTRGEQVQPPDAPAKPALILVGLVGGPIPSAMIDGVPGREGPVVVAVGDTFAGLRLRRIALGSVVVAGMDTTWTLTLPREQ